MMAIEHREHKWQTTKDAEGKQIGNNHKDTSIKHNTRQMAAKFKCSRITQLHEDICSINNIIFSFTKSHIIRI